jgi:hypothetical protein
MNLLVHDYSGGIERLWNSLDPKPEVREYPGHDLCGKDPRFAGKCEYVRGVGDVIHIVSSKAHDYTLAHELMHAVLRRRQGAATSYFDVRKRTHKDGTEELEIVTLTEDTLCWAHPIDRGSVVNQYAQAVDILKRTNTRDFTNFCEEFYCTVRMCN